uniref:Uncharacterized protein n=1 Tax=Nomascus leucogenys TaxID=61853 RepID=A0A2I3HAT8_NOMLE
LAAQASVRDRESSVTFEDVAGCLYHDVMLQTLTLISSLDKVLILNLTPHTLFPTGACGPQVPSSRIRPSPGHCPRPSLYLSLSPPHPTGV